MQLEKRRSLTALYMICNCFFRDGVETMHKGVPLTSQTTLGREADYVVEALAQNNWGGGGQFCQRNERFIESRFGTPRAILMSSCTTSLNVCGLLCNLQPGDEVIMPSFTFPSTANAVLLRGAKPVFVDIRSDTQNIDEAQVESAITDRTRAICVVHYAGVACEMDAILDIARRYDLIVIEDAAQGIFAKYNDRWLGTIGDLGCYSFHATKNISCGEGGALLINNQKFVERAEIVCEKGTNRSEFHRGEANKYEWRDMGTSVAPSEVAAALLYGQLQAADVDTQARSWAYAHYMTLLRPLEDRGYLRLPVIPTHCQSNHHIFYVLVSDRQMRTALTAVLNSNGICASFHYVPLHSSPYGEQFHDQRRSMANTDTAGACLLRLPLFADITQSDIELTVSLISDFFGIACCA